MNYKFFPVRPVAELGLPTLRSTAEFLAIRFPEKLAADLGLRESALMSVDLGRDSRDKPVVVRIAPAPGRDRPGYALRKSRTHLELRIPELRSKSECNQAVKYHREEGGIMLLELPTPWELVDDTGVSKQAAA